MIVLTRNRPIVACRKRMDSEKPALWPLLEVFCIQRMLLNDLFTVYLIARLEPMIRAARASLWRQCQLTSKKGRS